MNVLIILGHPRKHSFCAALADAYIQGATAAGISVQLLELCDLSFNPNVITAKPQHQKEEPDIQRAKKAIHWSDHIVFIYPTWWGNLPGILKSFLDRVFVPGFAFNEIQPDAYEKLLRPKTAQLISTMDTPLFVYKLIYGSPASRALSIATLKFCGISPVRKLFLSPVKHSSEKKKQQWIKKVYRLGNSLQHGPLTAFGQFRKNIAPWLQAVRFQFYPMTFLAYAAGGLLARQQNATFNAPVFWIGYFYFFLLEVAVVYSNDLYDLASDKLNRRFSPFSGGSRVLPNALISLQKFKGAINILLIICSLLFLILLFISPAQPLEFIFTAGIISLLALSYTIPPIQLSHRGWGELTVAITHSFAIILASFLFQGGSLQSAQPWIIGLPLFFSILPAILLSGIPDYDADSASGKQTLVVKIGRKSAVVIAIISTLLAASVAIHYHIGNPAVVYYNYAVWGAALHASLLAFLLIRFYKKNAPSKRIDKIMVIALLYILWFVIIPLITLL